MKKPRRGFPPGAHFVSFNFGNNLSWGVVSSAEAPGVAAGVGYALCEVTQA